MRVIGALGTLPARAESLVHTLRSLARQTVPLEWLAIFGDKYKSVEALSAVIQRAGPLPFFVLLRVGDVGTSSKYHAAMHSMGETEDTGSFVAFFDDDIDYDPRHVERSVALIRDLQVRLGTPKVRVGVLAEIILRERIETWNARDVRCVQFPFGAGQRLQEPTEVHNIGVGMMTASWEAADVFIPPLVAASPRLGCEPLVCGVCLDNGVRTFALPTGGREPLGYTMRRHTWMAHADHRSQEQFSAYAREVEWPPLPVPELHPSAHQRREERRARRRA